MAAESLSRQLPNLKSEISQVSHECKRSFFASPYNRPYTLIENDSDFPTIFMSFNGSAADILCVAHEFGHALQLYLASDYFIPPMHRGIAAFLAEHIFLEYIEEIRPDLSIDIRAAWDLDNRIYFENDIELLLEALKTPHITKYNYRHNYPLAQSPYHKQQKLGDYFRNVYSRSLNIWISATRALSGLWCFQETLIMQTILASHAYAQATSRLSGSKRVLTVS